MKLFAALLLSALVFSSLARAQEQWQPGQNEGAGPGGPVDMGGDTVPKESDGGSSGPMTADDARVNFASVVESFVAARSPNGFWPLKEKTTGNVLHLVLIDKEPKKVDAVEGSVARYTGQVLLRDQTTGDQVKASFTVDFSGSEWKVKSMKLLGKVAPNKKPAAKAAAPKKG